MRPLARSWLAVLIVTGCAEETPRPVQAPVADRAVRAPARVPAQLTDSARTQQLYDYGRSFGERRAAIQRQLGRPIQVEVESTENRHVAGTVDSLVRLRYPGLEFLLYWVAADSSEMLMNTWLTSPRGLPGGIRVGQTRTTMALARFGAPTQRDSVGDTLRLWYQRPTEGAEEFVQLYTLRDTVRGVRWAYYVD